jgi:aerobic-type carbon monoxide dehydrogenase small subunit (CoxS/CutS family)
MNSAKMLSLRINGSTVTMPLVPGETLATLLRERLGLTGTKIGCNEAECGTCTVLVNGEPTYPVRTRLHVHKEKKSAIEVAPSLPIRTKAELYSRAFVLHGAVQCGFCTPG